MSRDKEFKPLKEKETIDFIREKCSGNGNTLIEGKNEYSLPNCIPVESNKTWKMNAFYNGKRIMTNKEFGDAIIEWYNKYGKLYGLDANVLIAQMSQESGFKGWNYSRTGALGLTQFVPETIYSLIVKNSGNIEPNISVDEIKKIINNLTVFDTQDGINTITSHKNRAQLHQNVIDNPEIMIKAQARYMKSIATRCNNLTSSTLIGYNAGSGLVKDNYIDTVKRVISHWAHKPDKINEALEYVHKIFNIMYYKMGYKDLDMEKEFVRHDAQVASSDTDIQTQPIYLLPSSYD